MKKLGFLIFLLPICVFAQFGSQQIVDDMATNAFFVRAGDMDGDNDLDIVASLFDNVVWYENLDGQANFGAPASIITGLGQSFSLELEDLDGDSDLDIMITSFDNDQLLWLENLDGLGTFGTAQIISDTVLGVQTAMAADLDGDSDLDIVSTSDEDNTIAWFENTDGLGTFGPKIVITTSVLGRDSYVADMDGDDDLDIITSASDVNAIVSWFENVDGLGDFSIEHPVASTGTAGVEEIYAADLDGDEDLDIIVATPVNDRVSWFENLDGHGNFGSQIILTTDGGFPRSVYSADLDNDDDLDVLFMGSNNIEGKLAWFENLDGDGNFGTMQVIESDTDGSRTVFAADLDGDTDNDVLAGLLVADKVVWYENTTIASVSDFSLQKLRVYPNPVSDMLNLIVENQTVEQVRIYDLLGRLLLEQEGVSQTVDVSQLAAGLLLLEVTTNLGVGTLKILKD